MSNEWSVDQEVELIMKFNRLWAEPDETEVEREIVSRADDELTEAGFEVFRCSDGTPPVEWVKAQLLMELFNA